MLPGKHELGCLGGGPLGRQNRRRQSPRGCSRAALHRPSRGPRAAAGQHLVAFHPDGCSSLAAKTQLPHPRSGQFSARALLSHHTVREGSSRFPGRLRPCLTQAAFSGCGEAGSICLLQKQGPSGRRGESERRKALCPQSQWAHGPPRPPVPCARGEMLGGDVPGAGVALAPVRHRTRPALRRETPGLGPPTPHRSPAWPVGGAELPFKKRQKEGEMEGDGEGAVPRGSCAQGRGRGSHPGPNLPEPLGGAPRLPRPALAERGDSSPGGGGGGQVTWGRGRGRSVFGCLPSSVGPFSTQQRLRSPAAGCQHTLAPCPVCETAITGVSAGHLFNVNKVPNHLFLSLSSAMSPDGITE